jgi:hypothetical protein
MKVVIHEKIPVLLSDLMKLKKLYPFPCMFLAVLQYSKAFCF